MSTYNPPQQCRQFAQISSQLFEKLYNQASPFWTVVKNCQNYLFYKNITLILLLSPFLTQLGGNRIKQVLRLDKSHSETKHDMHTTYQQVKIWLKNRWLIKRKRAYNQSRTSSLVSILNKLGKLNWKSFMLFLRQHKIRSGRCSDELLLT